MPGEGPASRRFTLKINAMPAGSGEVAGGLEEVTEVWFGVPVRDAAAVGELWLDELVVADAAIGPVVVEPTSPHADDPARWLVLYNTTHPDAPAWAEHYRAVRSLPHANLLGLPLPLEETITLEAWAALSADVEGYLARTGLVDRVVGVVCGFAVPGYVRVHDGTGPGAGGIDGVVQAVSALLHASGGDVVSRANPLTPPIRGVEADGAASPRPTKANLSGLRLAARLDAATLAEAVELVDRAVAAEVKLTGTDRLYFNPAPGPGVGEAGRGLVEAAAAWGRGVEAGRMRLAVTSTVAGDEPTDAGYIEARPLSHVQGDAFIWDWSAWVGVSRAPLLGGGGGKGGEGGRRVACVLADPQGEGVSLRDAGAASPVLEAVRGGYAAVGASCSGASLDELPQPGRFFGALRAGWTLGEAWFTSLATMRRGMFLVGDPLMRATLPGAGHDVLAAVRGLESMDPWEPTAALPAASTEHALPLSDRPAEGEEAVYLVRVLDEAGRSELSARAVRRVNVGGVAVLPPQRVLWPHCAGWPVVVESGLGVCSLWLEPWCGDTSHAARLELYEAIGTGEGEMVQTLPVARDERWHRVLRSVEPGRRYRWRVLAENGVERWTPWSAAVEAEAAEYAVAEQLHVLSI